MSDQNNALVLEGGGFRSMFTAGVCDVLQEQGIYDFSSVWGVSAGAINAASFKSRQIGRCMRIMLAFRDDRRFMSLWAWAKTGNLTGGDFMYDEVENHLDPSDDATFNANPLRMFCVATDVLFGTPAYLEAKRFPDDVDMVRASTSMPLVSRTCELDGHLYLDGGTSDSVPFETALGLPEGHELEGYQPAKRALVVLTQDRSYVKTLGTEGVVLRSRRYDDYPYYKEALRTRHTRYNEQRERLWGLEEEADPRVLVLAPPEPVKVDVAGADGESLLTLYLQGRAEAEKHMEEIKAFLWQ